MRRIITIALLAGLAGCSDSGGTAQSAPPSRTEETAAAELMHGLVDRASLSDRWFEQTSTSPAVFKVTFAGQKETTSVMVSVTKSAKCKFVSRWEFDIPNKEPSSFELSADLTGLEPDKVGQGSRMESRKFTGASISCTASDDTCKTVGDGDMPILMPIPPVRFQQLATDFKAKYCS